MRVVNYTANELRVLPKLERLLIAEGQRIRRKKAEPQTIEYSEAWRKSRNELDAKRVAERRAQILAFLRSQTEPQPIPAIAAYMKASHATPKTYCHQLMADGLIGRVIGSAKGQHLWYYIGGGKE
ncbi:MAG: hypothetical protein Tp118SUR00d2C21406231_69 [Prokaryotic dsDNA virus sp.]|nr:MAG: hypothetical protein Tp125DCM00d2C40298531_10 [Prokaryotic dsDNA virus sp.]QDP53189.1 MAG: hypothetical protein Tp118SUR00d2C21406231_69 [Prokaryotic dsDNA virus sp.]|tara:strand:+ start:36018 stop:36392 length:375 start_codon:yes stop_codon:yes gene_type:complete